jgi:hypothetical protein
MQDLSSIRTRVETPPSGASNPRSNSVSRDLLRDLSEQDSKGQVQSLDNMLRDMSIRAALGV